MNIEQWIYLARAEIRGNKGKMVLIFVVVSLLFLIAGLYWPKKYESSTTILASEKNIITPLMEGTAVATGVQSLAGNAKEIMLSRRVLEQVMEYAGWPVDKMSPLEIEITAENISKRTRVDSIGVGLLRISYVDKDPRRAFKTTERFAELFIQESLRAKQNESRAAFEFVDNQVKLYHKKLLDAESRLKAFRGSNADARPGSQTDVDARITQLRQQLEQTRLQLSEARERENALNRQLSGEAAFSAQLTKEQQFRERIVELQQQRDNLLLNFRESHPDVIRLNHQIREMEDLIAAETARRKEIIAALRGGRDDSRIAVIQSNPLYQQLRQQLSDTRTEIATLETRVRITNGFLTEALERSVRITDSEAELAELMRDYEVNRTLYSDLLRRRENARVSMSLDQEGQGLSFKIQEPAALPLKPSGLRLLHFMMAGLLLGGGIPLGMIAAVVQLDPRVRQYGTLKQDLKLRILAVVPTLQTSRDRRTNQLVNASLGLVMVAVIVCYGYVGYLRYTQAA